MAQAAELKRLHYEDMCKKTEGELVPFIMNTWGGVNRAALSLLGQWGVVVDDCNDLPLSRSQGRSRWIVIVLRHDEGGIGTTSPPITAPL